MFDNDEIWHFLQNYESNRNKNNSKNVKFSTLSFRMSLIITYCYMGISTQNFFLFFLIFCV